MTVATKQAGKMLNVVERGLQKRQNDKLRGNDRGDESSRRATRSAVSTIDNFMGSGYLPASLLGCLIRFHGLPVIVQAKRALMEAKQLYRSNPARAKGSIGTYVYTAF
jgi:hypothetical protein